MRFGALDTKTVLVLKTKYCICYQPLTKTVLVLKTKYCICYQPLTKTVLVLQQTLYVDNKLYMFHNELLILPIF